MARKALIAKHKKLMRRRQRIYEERKRVVNAWWTYVPPKDRQPTKFYNRCQATWKTRAYMRDFGVSRQAFRKFARQWVIMWLKKASW